METLREIYQRHEGKVSQKWDLFLDVYDSALSYLRDKPVNYVEAGVQNGGSLEIAAKYFARALSVTGVDPDPRCAALTFDDPRIAVVNRPINTAAAAREVLARGSPVHVFVDDGSHLSLDVIMGFLNWFPAIAPGGIYIAEDLHCAYRPDYMGGIDAPNSMEFFKTLVDCVHARYWTPPQPIEDRLARFLPAGARPDLRCVADIAAISFYDSICVVHKRPANGWGRLGPRRIAGRVAAVDPRILDLGGEEP